MARKITKEEFLQRWTNSNNYELISEYKGFAENIIVKDKYGELITKPLYLIKNKPLSILSAVDKTNYTINRFKEKHGDKYSYEKFIYEGSTLNSVITCHVHGDFLQTPANHLRHGCHSCNVSNNGFSKKDFIKRGENKISKLYLVECWNSTEKFIKIGITSQSIRNRFIRNRDMPYEYKLLESIESIDADIIFEKEKLLKRTLKNKFYSPVIKFAGSKECYKFEYINEFINLFSDIKVEINGKN